MFFNLIGRVRLLLLSPERRPNRRPANQKQSERKENRGRPNLLSL